MIEITIDKKLFELPKDLRRKLKRAEAALAVEHLLEGRNQYAQVDAVAGGETRDSGRVQEGLNGFSVNWTGAADIVERGRRPNRKIPPWRIFKLILRKWAARRGLSLTDGELYAVALKIKRDGFKGKYPIKRAVEYVKASGRGDAAISDAFEVG